MTGSVEDDEQELLGVAWGDEEQGKKGGGGRILRVLLFCSVPICTLSGRGKLGVSLPSTSWKFLSTFRFAYSPFHVPLFTTSRSIGDASKLPSGPSAEF